MLNKLILILVIIWCGFAICASSGSRYGSSIYFTELGHLKHQAKLGDPNAQFLLGNLYFSPPKETALKPNLKKAVDYYFDAAIRDHAGAQYNLGVLYYRGLAVTESKMMAYVWFTFADKNTSSVSKSIKKSAAQLLSDINNTLSEEEKKEASELIEKYDGWIRRKEYRTARLPND